MQPYTLPALAYFGLVNIILLFNSEAVRNLHDITKQRTASVRTYD
jgi:hypothetical protein